MNDIITVGFTMVVCIALLVWLKISTRKEPAKNFLKSKWYFHPNYACITGFLLVVFAAGLFLKGFTMTAAVFFIIAAFLDGVDGALARTRECATELGAFIDSCNDKLRNCPALIYFAITGLLPTSLVWVYIAFEFAGQFVIRPAIYITNKVLGTNITIASNYFGKVKTPIADFLVVYCILLKRQAFTSGQVETVLLTTIIILSLLSIIFKFIPFDPIRIGLGHLRPDNSTKNRSNLTPERGEQYGHRRHKFSHNICREG